MLLILLSFFVLMMSFHAEAYEYEFSGVIAAEGRLFPNNERFDGQHSHNGSIYIKPEFYFEWDEGDQSFLFVPFGRLDQGDSKRTHLDIRELSYVKAAEAWELRVGLRKVFWGVAESNHLIDIVNQTDLVENLDTEDKLGQPMINLAIIRDWGTIDFFILPGFRERTFPGKSGRLRAPFRVDDSEEDYESAAKNKHVDYAIRYSHYFGDYDIGLYHFWGTSREPLLFPTLTSSNELVFGTRYDLIHQTGLDVQATKGNWLFKLEALRREGQAVAFNDDTFYATVGGFEYTFVGLKGTAMDLGVIGEYHFDDRGESFFAPFNNDVFVGGRLAFNDAQDTQVLGGVIADLNGNANFFNIEASRRIGDRWKIEAEARIFFDVDRLDPFWSLDKDDYLQLELARYF